VATIILVHGLFGFDRLRLGSISVDYFGDIARTIARRGHRVLVPRLHPTASVARRAEQLRGHVLDFIGRHSPPGRRIVIIAHSLGGLDARCMISRMDMAQHVAALVTIATPHRGTALADFWLRNYALARLAMPLCAAIGLDVGAARDLAREAARRFNDQTPDHPDVRYFSVAAACPPRRMPLALRPAWTIVHRAEGANDGAVSVRSAVWGKHLATWPVHHLHAVNHRFPMDVFAPVGSVAPLYLRILDQLAACGALPE